MAMKVPELWRQRVYVLDCHPWKSSAVSIDRTPK